MPETAFPVIDFHTHPFLRPADNICRYQSHLIMAPDRIVSDLKAAGISHFCGSVIRTREAVAAERDVKPDDLTWWDVIHACNEDALELRDALDGVYTPGIMVHPDFVPQSLAEMEALYARGVRLIGELVP